MSLSLVVCPPWLRTRGKIIARPWASHFPFRSLYFRMCKTGRIGRASPRAGQPQGLSSLHLGVGGWGGGRTPPGRLFPRISVTFTTGPRWAPPLLEDRTTSRLWARRRQTFLGARAHSPGTWEGRVCPLVLQTQVLVPGSHLLPEPQCFLLASTRLAHWPEETHRHESAVWGKK